MTILLMGSVLLGAVLGRFFKVLVLAPACAFVFVAILVRFVYVEHGLLRPLLEFAGLITSLQIGYVLGLLSSSTKNARLVSAYTITRRHLRNSMRSSTGSRSTGVVGTKAL